MFDIMFKYLFTFLIFINVSNLCGAISGPSIGPQIDWVEVVFTETIYSMTILIDEHDFIITTTNVTATPPPFRSFLGKGDTPMISPIKYLQHLRKYFGCSRVCFSVARIYIDRIISRANLLHISNVFNNISFYRMYLAALVVAIKFIDDFYYSNKFYAEKGGVRTEELNLLETDLLKAIDLDLFITPQVLENFYLDLEIFLYSENFRPFHLSLKRPVYYKARRARLR